MSKMYEQVVTKSSSMLSRPLPRSGLEDRWVFLYIAQTVLLSLILLMS